MTLHANLVQTGFFSIEIKISWQDRQKLITRYIRLTLQLQDAQKFLYRMPFLRDFAKHNYLLRQSIRNRVNSQNFRARDGNMIALHFNQ